MNTNFTNNDHPELREGEIFLNNVKPADEEYQGFAAIGWKTKRLGNIAYNVFGDILPHHRPVFVLRSEMEQADVEFNKPVGF